jgi:hypothetical protein
LVTGAPDMAGAGRTSRGLGIGVRPGKKLGDRREWSLATISDRVNANSGRAG